MFAEVPASEEKDLERLYAQTRCHDLLSSEQERELDERKWEAIRRILELLCADPWSHHYLMRWATNCREPLPAIEQFRHREHRFLLRRELGDYLPGGSDSAKIHALLEKFAKDSPNGTILSGLLELSLPATLVVGMAEVAAQTRIAEDGITVAAALLAWEQQWLPQQAADVANPEAATVTSLQEQIRDYITARDLLITHNFRLVYAIAGRNRNSGATFLDLVQEGNLGLLRAAEKFQVERGYRFTTYAFNWINQHINRYLADSAGAIRYPSHIQEQLGKLYAVRGNKLASSGTLLRDSELASALGMPVAKTRELLQLRNFNFSLDAPRSEDEPGTTLLDTIPGGPFPDPVYEAEQASLNRRLFSQIRLLTPAEQRVVIQRWGLHKEPPLTRAEIANKMSLSSERIRQLELSALEKLRKLVVVDGY
jgi:RNA polymerase sigma factor (sigma-70 family)